LCQFWAALHDTLFRFLQPSPQPPNLHWPHLKQLQEVSWFYFTHVYEAYQPYSLTFISSIHSSSPTSTPSHTHCTYFTILSSVINSKVNVQRSFSTYSNYEQIACLPNQIQLIWREINDRLHIHMQKLNAPKL
jgi:hypothetical protein